RAAALLTSFPGQDQAPVILVVSRPDGSVLAPGDLRAADSARQRVLASAGGAVSPPLNVSRDGRAAVAPIPLATGVTGFALNDTVIAMRKSAAAGSPDDLAV